MLLICAHNFFSHDLWLIFPSSTCLFVWGLWVCHHLVLGSNAYPQQWTVKNYLPYLMKAFSSFTLPPLYFCKFIMLMHIHNLDFLNPETCSIPVSGYGFQNVWHHVPIQPWAMWFHADSVLGLVMYACICFWSIFKELSDHSGIWRFCWTGTRLADVRATSFRHNIGGHGSIFQSFYGSTSRQGRISGDPQDVLKMTFDMCMEFQLQSIIKILWMRFSLVGQVSVVILCPIYRPKYVSRETWNVFLSLVAHHKICGPIVCFFNSTDNFGHWIISEISCLFSNCNEQSRRLSFQVFRIGFHEIGKLYKVKVKI